MSNGDQPASELTKRECLAGMALQGILASYSSEFPDDSKASRWAMEYADALLAALDGKSGTSP